VSGDPGGGNCTFCFNVFGLGFNNGEGRARAQIVQVTNVAGTTLTISPALFTDFVHNLPTWAAATVYSYATYITANGHTYVQSHNNASPFTCTSGSSTPTFPTNGTSVVDNTCTWLDQGVGTTTAPMVTPFTPTVNAGVSNLQIQSTVSTSNSIGQDILMKACM